MIAYLSYLVAGVLGIDGDQLVWFCDAPGPEGEQDRSQGSVGLPRALPAIPSSSPQKASTMV